MSKQKKQKKESNGIAASILCIILFLAAGIGLIVSESKYLFSAPRDMNDVVAAGAPQKGEYVTVDVKSVIDWYAETQYKINGIIPAGKTRHCLVMLDDGTIMSLTVKGKNVDKIDDVITVSWSTGFTNTNAVPLSGQVTSIGSEVYKYFGEALSAYGISASDGYVIYELTIDTTKTKLKTWLYFAFCMALVAVFVFTLIANIKNKKKKEAAAAAAARTQADNLYDNSYAQSVIDGTDENNLNL